ncbi:receptor activity-modifying protein 1-like [Solea solea]|uniref:receptor activity-modifying protein 1-like n=1 Tax=Solea solea TaxID=90069 RepID=UPI00272BC553|nr:receptor activity-modifying protein 1-like [Solea solea]
MIVSLLLVFLITGVEESQQTNNTDVTQAETNQTSTLFTDASNLTVSLETSEIEAKLQDNETSVITEDEDAFMEQPFTTKRCQHDLLLSYSHIYCEDHFDHQMLELGSEKWCHLDSVTGAYSEVTTCMEKLTGLVDCFYPNTYTQDFFLSVHARYFKNCGKDELVFEDAPHWVMMVLTLIPVSLIPILVCLVIWKSKVQE